MFEEEKAILDQSKKQLDESIIEMNRARAELEIMKEVLEKQKIDEKKTRYFFALTIKGYIADDDSDDAIEDIEFLVRQSFPVDKIQDGVVMQSRQIFVHDNKI